MPCNAVRTAPFTAGGHPQHPMAYADVFAAATDIAHDGELWTGDPELLVPGAPWSALDLRESADGFDWGLSIGVSVPMRDSSVDDASVGTRALRPQSGGAAVGGCAMASSMVQTDQVSGSAVSEQTAPPPVRRTAWPGMEYAGMRRCHSRRAVASARVAMRAPRQRCGPAPKAKWRL